MSLYLKYRPSDFSSLVGQEFTKQTLQKAIDQDKTVGAYLFCGPRGTGKTSSARIFAKAINCLDTQNGNPCGKCKVCTDFKDDRLVDIIEIDAASHTGVDNIRDIIERAQFSPNFCTYKIYIIDEVHMLSKGAFNALLKILEEPPKHVKFILATTETHKVPDTIISRCQRYDFKRISAEDITARLLFIAKSEEVTIDEKSLDYIVKNSGGGLRNAISLFEQLIVDNDINFNVVVEKLGIVDEDILESFMKKLLQKDTTIIGDFDTLVSDGKNMKVFFKELIFYIKNKAIGELKYNNPIGEYIGVLDILDEVYGKTKNSLDENTTFIIGILKIVSQYTNTQEKTQVSSVQVMDKKNVEIKSTQTSTQEMKQKSTLPTQNSEKQELLHNDVLDVFGDVNQPESTPKVENNSTGDIKDFNLKNFILLLKNNGAKGGLTMALRGSGVELIGNSLIIRTKTKIASTQVNNIDNIALMSKVLVDMGVDNPEIKPN